MVWTGSIYVLGLCAICAPAESHALHASTSTADTAEVLDVSNFRSGNASLSVQCGLTDEEGVTRLRTGDNRNHTTFRFPEQTLELLTTVR